MKKQCEVCGGTDVLSLDEHFRDVDMVSCTQCGLVWNRNMAEEPEQLEFYQEHNRAEGCVSRRYLVSMLSRAASAVEFLGSNLKPGMRHLDVGCADGTLLSLTRAQGLDVLGLELDIHFSQFARDARHLEVLPMTLDSAPLEPTSFDLISFVHVVEHLVYPTRVLADARELLREDGLLYLEVPNLRQPLPRLRHFFRPKHNFYFTANTLRAVASKSGFTPLQVGYSRRDSSVQLLARKNRSDETAPATTGAPLWRDDAHKIKAKVQRERNRHYLLLRLLFTRKLRQEKAKRWAMELYGDLLPKIP
ncbi:MAG TPA: class I SAM-dependent methyltransferase [Abditibacteriaceae bacterium]